MSRNPYCREGEPPRLLPSAFAFFDILGYRNMVNEAEGAASGENLLVRLHDTLGKARKHLGQLNEGYARAKDLFTLKAFTDNIVVGWPVHDDAEAELGGLFDRLAKFQLELALAGFFVRGAISVGEAYVDEIVVFGGALVEAYRGESEIARDPRVILAPSARAAVKSHLEYYGNPRCAPQNSVLLTDADGQAFIHYLDAILMFTPDLDPFFDELMLHKQQVEEKLSQHQSNPPVWSKYAWVAKYHNHFCKENRNYFDDTFRIDIDLFQAGIQRLVE